MGLWLTAMTHPSGPRSFEPEIRPSPTQPDQAVEDQTDLRERRHYGGIHRRSFEFQYECTVSSWSCYRCWSARPVVSRRWAARPVVSRRWSPRLVATPSTSFCALRSRALSTGYRQPLRRFSFRGENRDETIAIDIDEGSQKSIEITHRAAYSRAGSLDYTLTQRHGAARSSS